jgi:hypothetical protein
MSYDQRNTQIYDRLVRRAKFLERQLGFQPLPGDKYLVSAFSATRADWIHTGMTFQLDRPNT